MAVINFFDNPLASSQKKIIKKESSVRDLVNKYLDKKDHKQKYEVYNPKTGKTSYKIIEADTYKVATVVNGKEEGLDYIVKKDDVVDIIFSPRSNSNSADWLSIAGGVFVSVIGVIIAAATSWTGVGAMFGVSLIIGGAAMTTAGIISAATRKPTEYESKDNSQLEKNKALTIKGAENQLITGQRFPFIFGKFAVNPYIVGSPFHETFAATSGKFESQYQTCLYCLGYGPLKLTNLKIAETVLCYNRPRDLYDQAKTFSSSIAESDGYYVYDAVTDSYSVAAPQPTENNFSEGNYFTYNDSEAYNPTVMHGRIDPHTLSTSFNQTVANRGEYYTYNSVKRSYDKADPQPTADTWRPDYYYELNNLIPAKWKNNDVQIEILQRGLKETDIPNDDKFGTLYNQTVCEDEVGASIIYIHDNDISEAAEKQYKGVAVPKGYRTNTVHLSQNCPIKIEVELDFQNGLYRSRPEKQSNVSALRLYDIPVRFAVQWRPVKKGNQVSNAESGEGWRSFDYLMIGENRSTWQTPKPYLARHAVTDMSLNAGASRDGMDSMFRDGLTRYANDYIYPSKYNEVLPRCQSDAASVYKPYSPYTGERYTASEQAVMSSSSAASQSRSYTDSWIDPSDYGKVMTAMDAGYITEPGFNYDWLGTDVFCINENKNYGTAYGPKSFDGNERIYPFVKEFTKEEVDEILATGTNYVEVRVIRLTPCYIDQSGTDNENYGDFSYEDLCQWSYMRTTCFDKDAYTEALKTNSAADPHDFPLRPIRESDLKKFSYIAIRLKQDVTEVGGSTLRKLRMLAESFSPKYDVENKTWNPPNVEVRYGYYQKVKIGNSWQIIELTESEYFEKVAAREPHLFKKRKGNNFTQQVADDIFRAPVSVDGENETEFHWDFIKNFILADNGLSNDYEPFVWNVLKQMMLPQSSYKPFAETQGGISVPSEYNTTLDLTAASRKVTGSQMIAAGYTEFDSNDYATYYSAEYWYDSNGNEVNSNPAFTLVVTPILDNGTILTKEQVHQDVNKIAKGQTPTYDILCARFSGANARSDSAKYCEVLHCVGACHYADAQSEVHQEWLALKDFTFDEYYEKVIQEENADKVRRHFANQPFDTYILSKEVEDRYIDNNTACSTLLAMVGQHNGEEAKCYDDINMESAAELYKFCSDVTDGQTDKDGNLLHIKYSCNGILTEEKKLEDIVKTFLLTGRSIIRRDDENRYEFFIGRKVNYPVALLNTKNVLTKSNTRTFQEVPSGLQLTYPSEDDDYTNNPLYVMDRGEDWKNPSKPMEQFQLQYVTNRDQIRSLALYNLAARLYQRETYTWTVGKIGLTFSVGDMVLLQDDSILTGTDHAGRIMEVLKENDVIYGFITDEPYEYTGETENGESVQGVTIVQPNKYGPSRCVTLRMATVAGNAMIPAEKMTIGLTRIVALAHPITVTEDGNFSEESLAENGEFCTLDPKEGDLVSFGIMSKITRKAQIMAIKPSQNKFSLTMVPYSDDFFEYGRELPQFNPALTIQPREVEQIEFSPYATKKDVAESKANADDNKKNLTIDLTAETTITTCKATRDGIIMICETYTTGNNRQRLTPISVTWTIAKENVWSEYFVADPQPLSQEDLDAGTFYYKDEDDHYLQAEIYESGVTYYTAVAHVEDVPVMQITSMEETYSFVFDRAQPVSKLGGYPEIGDFAGFKIQASAKLTVATKTIDSFFTRIDTTDYGTWIPLPPIIDQTVQDRNAVLTFSQPEQQKVLYGTEAIIYRVRIRRLIDNSSEKYAKPNLQDSPRPEYVGEVVSRGNEYNYKILKLAEPQPSSQSDIDNGEYYTDETLDFERADTFDATKIYYTVDEGYVQAGKTFSQTLPLLGQKNKDIKSTNYQYEVCAESVSGVVTDVSTAVVLALFTNFRDIVYANSQEKAMYVQELSAITANLGEITDGSLSGNEENYWTLSDKPNARQEPGQDNKNFQGAFRVGGTNSFIKVIPILDPTTHQVVDYKTEIATDSVQIAGNEIDFHNGIYLYDDNDYTTHGREGIAPYYTKRLFVSYRGIELETYDYQTRLWNRIAQVGLKQSSSMIITNDIDGTDIPKEGIETGASSYVYHFDVDTNDEDGNDTVDFDFDGSIISDPDMNPVFEGSKIFSGVIEKQQFNEVGSHAFFIKDGYVELFGDFVTTDGGGNINDFNSIMSTASMGGSMTFAIKE